MATVPTPKIGTRIPDVGITCCGSYGCGANEPMERAGSGFRTCKYCDCVVQYDGVTITSIRRCKDCR